MPVSVVVGGQYGSEGKGKVSLALAQRRRAAAVVRIGGPNSGHTAQLGDGVSHILRQLPTASLLHAPVSVLPPGCYLDEQVLLTEIHKMGLPSGKLMIDPLAVMVEPAAARMERTAGLGARIGSTESGTGAAVAARVQRFPDVRFAADCPSLSRWLAPTGPFLAELLDADKRVIVEGTQGSGLSVLHSPDFPFVTSRDTSAAAAISEAGVSPIHVDEVVMVLRSYPIRVAGNSGPLADEITWDMVAIGGGHGHQISELTSVTRRVRRVACFSPEIPLLALRINAPTSIALNHLDYIDHNSCISGGPTRGTDAFVDSVEDQLGVQIDWCGYGPATLEPRSEASRATA